MLEVTDLIYVEVPEAFLGSTLGILITPIIRSIGMPILVIAIICYLMISKCALFAINGDMAIERLCNCHYL